MTKKENRVYPFTEAMVLDAIPPSTCKGAPADRTGPLWEKAQATKAGHRLYKHVRMVAIAESEILRRALACKEQGCPALTKDAPEACTCGQLYASIPNGAPREEYLTTRYDQIQRKAVGTRYALSGCHFTADITMEPNLVSICKTIELLRLEQHERNALVHEMEEHSGKKKTTMHPTRRPNLARRVQ